MTKANGSNGSVMEAIKEDCNMAKLQTTLRQIYDQYHYFLKALGELRLIAEALEEKVLTAAM